MLLPSLKVCKGVLRNVLANKKDQGHLTDEAEREVESLDSYDAVAKLARKIANLPVKPDWTWIEPSDLGGIWAQCDPSRPTGVVGTVDLADAARRVEAGFLASLCGCVLGKPLEISPTLAELQSAFEAIGEWPLRQYISERVGPSLPRPFHHSWKETVRERIRYVASDDDINYTILGMLILEQHGVHFTRAHVRNLWLEQLPVGHTFGPERTQLIKAALNTLDGGGDGDMEEWVTLMSPREEYCGALIRADAYGYACPGRPALAAELAWRDAAFTHRRTGIYGTMFVAAAIALAQVVRDPLEVFNTAAKFIPRTSRFYKLVTDSLTDVSEAKDWLDGYSRIHNKYGQYGHCRVFQEVGTLINTLRFAQSVGDGICKQVMQGNDTDSFGATAGSILGCFFGPGHLDPRWLTPFNDDIHTALALFYERSVSKLAHRMAQLPALVAAQIEYPAMPPAHDKSFAPAASGSGVAEVKR